MLRPLLGICIMIDETGCAMVILLPWCDFPLLMWLLRIAAVPWGWCDFSRLMWLKYGACSCYSSDTFPCLGTAVGAMTAVSSARAMVCGRPAKCPEPMGPWLVALCSPHAARLVSKRPSAVWLPSVKRCWVPEPEGAETKSSVLSGRPRKQARRSSIHGGL